MAFRAQSGIDDRVYRRLFLRAGVMDLPSYLGSTDIEGGYMFLNYLLYFLTNGNYNIAQSIISYLSFIFWGLAIWNHKDFHQYTIPILFLFSHYYFAMMWAGLVRIFLAVSIVYFAISYLWKYDWKRYVFWIAAASMFHRSAWIMLLLVIFAVFPEWAYKRWDKILIVECLAVPALFLFVAQVIAPFLGERYGHYSVIHDLSVSTGDFDILPLAIIGIIYLQNASREEKPYYIISFILIVLSIAFDIFSSMVELGRLKFYMNLGVVILAAGVCGHKPKNFAEYLTPFLLIVYAFLYVMRAGHLQNAIETYTSFAPFLSVT